MPKLRNISKQSKASKEDKTSSSILKDEPNKNTVVYKTSSESDTSVKANYSRFKLNDAITVQNTNNGKTLFSCYTGKLIPEEKRTFASLGQRQNGVIINRPMNDSLEVILPPRSKSAQDLEARTEDEYSSLSKLSMLSLSASLPRHSKDMATQTVNFKTILFIAKFFRAKNIYLPLALNSSTVCVPLKRIQRRLWLIQEEKVKFLQVCRMSVHFSFHYVPNFPVKKYNPQIDGKFSDWRTRSPAWGYWRCIGRNFWSLLSCSN